MSVYIDVWHRTHPLTPDAHRRFLEYYGQYVVAPPSDYFEVVGGFRYTDGPSSEDFALYRYASMAQIEESMMSFGADPDFVAATEALFTELEIEETRGIAVHTPYSPEDRIDEMIAEGRERSGARRYLRSVRTCGGTERMKAYEALEARRDLLEKSECGRLVAGFQYLVGPVMDLVEIWVLPEDHVEWPRRVEEIGFDLASELARIAPERERRGIEPVLFSKLR